MIHLTKLSSRGCGCSDEISAIGWNISNVNGEDKEEEEEEEEEEVSAITRNFDLNVGSLEAQLKVLF